MKEIVIHDVKKRERLFVNFHILNGGEVLKSIKIDYSLDTTAKHIKKEGRKYLAKFIRFIEDKEKNKDKNLLEEQATKTVNELLNLTTK